MWLIFKLNSIKGIQERTLLHTHIWSVEIACYYFWFQEYLEGLCSESPEDGRVHCSYAMDRLCVRPWRKAHNQGNHSERQQGEGPETEFHPGLERCEHGEWCVTTTGRSDDSLGKPPRLDVND